MEQKKRNAKGMGSFKKNPDGTVTHRKSVGYTAKGTRKVLVVTAETQSACIKKMKIKEAEWNEKKRREEVSATIMVEELCAMHLQYQISNNELKAKSIDRRECTIDQLSRFPFSKMEIGSVQVADVDNFVSLLVKDKVFSASSINKILDVLNAAYKWAVLREQLPKNPVEPVKESLKKRILKLDARTSTEADVDVLSLQEQKRFEEVAKSLCDGGSIRYPAGIYGLLLLHTGMRVGEALALRWRDVDFENKTLNIDKSRSMAKNRNQKDGETAYVMNEGTTKNSKARKIELTEAALEDLRAIRYRQKEATPDSYILITRTGKPHTTTSIEHRMKTIYHAAGLTHLKGGVHILRKTFATGLYERGIKEKEIAAYIGDLESTTKRYYIAVRKKWMIDGVENHIVALSKM